MPADREQLHKEVDLLSEVDAERTAAQIEAHAEHLRTIKQRRTAWDDLDLAGRIERLREVLKGMQMDAGYQRNSLASLSKLLDHTHDPMNGRVLVPVNPSGMGVQGVALSSGASMATDTETGKPWF